MPTKFCGRAPVLPASGYTQLDPVKGTCDVFIQNTTNGTISVVTNAGNATEAAAEETAGRNVVYAAVPGAIFQFQADPSRTWVKWNGTTVGTNWYTFVISW